MDNTIHVKEKYLIGEVSKMYGISSDLLRHYDKIGLLKAEKDKSNGYRYYNVYQLTLLGLILKLRFLDISLEDIKIAIYSESPNRYLNLITLQEDHLEKQINHLLKLKAHTTDIRQQLESEIDKSMDLKLVMSPEFWIALGPRAELKNDLDVIKIAAPFHEYSYEWNSISRFGSIIYKDTLMLETQDFALGIISEHSPESVDNAIRYLAPHKSFYAIYRGAHEEIPYFYIKTVEEINRLGYQLSNDIIERFIANYIEEDTYIYSCELWFPIE